MSRWLSHQNPGILLAVLFLTYATLGAVVLLLWEGMKLLWRKVLGMSTTKEY